MNRTRGPRILGIATILVSLALPLYAGHYRWSTNGPEPGRIFQIVAYAQDPNRLYARTGTIGTQVSRSNDGGQSWCYLIESTTLVPDPSNPDVFYVVAEFGALRGLLKTSDGGTTWQAAGEGLPNGSAFSVAVSRSSPSTLYALAGTTAALYRSDDSGAHWNSVGDAPASANLVAADAHDSETLYVYAGGGFFVSDDGGVEWTPAGAGLSGSPTRFTSDPGTPGVVWAYKGVAGVQKSIDGGQTFLPPGDGLTSQTVMDLAFDLADPSHLYAAVIGAQFGTTLNATTPGGLFVSVNGGDSWEAVPLGPSSPVSGYSVAFDGDSSRLYVGGATSSGFRLLESTDGGVSWELRDHGLSGYYTYATMAHPTLPGTAFGFSSNRFFTTADSGRNWMQVGSTQFTVDSLVFDPANPQVLYGQYNGFVNPDYYGGVYKSVDGGAQWEDASVGLTNAIANELAIGVSGPNVLLASNYDGTFKSIDGGGSWEMVLSGTGRGVAIDPADGNILYATRPHVTGQAEFVRSSDGGAEWNGPAGVDENFTPADIAIRPDDPDIVYAGGGWHVYKSADRGLSFSPANEGIPQDGSASIYRLALDPSAPATLYAGGGNLSRVYRTTDGAATWKPIPSKPPLLSLLDLTVSADGRTIYAAGDSGVFQFHRAFTDVPDNDPFWSSVDAAALNAVTAGCGSGTFCPRNPNTRAQIAPMLLRAKNGALYAPPPANGTFADVPPEHFAVAWIDELARLGIAAGCGGDNYCPGSPVTRAQFAVFVLKTKHGSDYEPPPATGTVFTDVPADAFAAAWIEELYAEGIAAGCGDGLFCPNDTVLRAQAVALLVKAFGLS